MKPEGSGRGGGRSRPLSYTEQAQQGHLHDGRRPEETPPKAQNMGSKVFGLFKSVHRIYVQQCRSYRWVRRAQSEMKDLLGYNSAEINDKTSISQVRHSQISRCNKSLGFFFYHENNFKITCYTVSYTPRFQSKRFFLRFENCLSPCLSSNPMNLGYTTHKFCCS